MTRGHKENLVRFDQMDPDKHKELSSRGGKAAAKANRERKEMRALAAELLNMPLKNGKSKSFEEIKSLAEIKGKNISVQEAILYSLAGKALKGDVPAAAFFNELTNSKTASDEQSARRFSFDPIGIIAPTFYAVHQDIKEGNHTYYDLYGGRGSTKSSFVSLEIVNGVMQDPQANAVVFRKVANTIGTSVYEQILWAINELGVEDDWHCTTSPYKCVYKPTGQVILFRGLDKAEKTKSVKVSKGYIKFLWFEELDQFAGEEEIRNVQQSVLRGGDSFVVFKSFNPPISKSNWANEYVTIPKQDALRHKSCYLDVPPDWLGQQFINDAEDLKEVNPRAYEHEYLGVPVGAGGEVFDNVVPMEMPDQLIAGFDQVYMGVDWGWYPDPYQWVKMHYDAAHRALYIFDELRCNKTSNEETWRMLKEEKGVRETDLITADSAEKKSVGDYRSYGSFCRAAIKGPDSVRYGIKWLQSLVAINIDPVRCPNAYKEFSNYEYERTPDGEVISSFPDENNHAIDATRYAMEQVWKRKGR